MRIVFTFFQCSHNIIEVDFGCRLKALPTCTSSAAHLGHVDSVKSLYHIDGGGCDYAKGMGSSAQRLHAILADRSCRTQGPGDAPPVFTGVSCAQGFQRRPCAVQRLADSPWPEAG